jgi:hypothetical protein
MYRKHYRLQLRRGSPTLGLAWKDNDPSPWRPGFHKNYRNPVFEGLKNIIFLIIFCIFFGDGE